MVSCLAGFFFPLARVCRHPAAVTRLQIISGSFCRCLFGNITVSVVFRILDVLVKAETLGLRRTAACRWFDEDSSRSSVQGEYSLHADHRQLICPSGRLCRETAAFSVFPASFQSLNDSLPSLESVHRVFCCFNFKLSAEGNLFHKLLCDSKPNVAEKAQTENKEHSSSSMK